MTFKGRTVSKQSLIYWITIHNIIRKVTESEDNIRGQEVGANAVELYADDQIWRFVAVHVTFQQNTASVTYQDQVTGSASEVVADKMERLVAIGGPAVAPC